MVQQLLVYEGERLNKRVHDLEREVDRLLSELGRAPKDKSVSALLSVTSSELRRLREGRGF